MSQYKIRVYGTAQQLIKLILHLGFSRGSSLQNLLKIIEQSGIYSNRAVKCTLIKCAYTYPYIVTSFAWSFPDNMSMILFYNSYVQFNSVCYSSLLQFLIYYGLYSVVKFFLYTSLLTFLQIIYSLMNSHNLHQKK